MKKSCLHGEGHGSKHVWQNLGSATVRNGDRQKKHTLYQCGVCQQTFKHFYDLDPDIFQAMKHAEIPESCKSDQKEKERREGFTDDELKGTWIAKINLQSADLENYISIFKRAISPLHYNTSALINKGETWEENRHITLGLKLPAPTEEVKAFINQIEEIVVEIDVSKAEVFQKDVKDPLTGQTASADIIVFPVQSSPLFKIHSYLCKSAGVVWPYSGGYKPHVTMCYIQKGKGAEYIAEVRRAYQLCHGHAAPLPFRVAVQRIVFAQFRNKNPKDEIVVDNIQ